MKYVLYLSVTALLLVTTCFAQTISIYDENFGGPINLNLGMGQSFTATQTGTINQIDVMLFFQPLDATLYLYNSNDGSGGGPNEIGTPAYVQGSVQIIPSQTQLPEWVSIILTTPFNVIAGEQYSFVLANENDVTLYGAEYFDLYSGGNFIYGYGLSEPNGELFFRIWESPAAPTPTPLKAWPLAFLLIIPAGLWAGKRIF